MPKMNCALTDAEINHLRKLLAYVGCDIGQSPEEIKETLKSIAPAVGVDIDAEAVARLKQSYEKSAAVPQYVRAAVKALRKTLIKHEGEIVDVNSTHVVREIGSK